MNHSKKLIDDEHIIYSDNEYLNQIIQNYEFHVISKKSDFDIYKLLKNIDESVVMIINKSCKLNLPADDQFICIGMKNKIIIIRQSLISLFEKLLSSVDKLIICFLSNTKEIFDENFQINYHESISHCSFQEEIHCINSHIIMKGPYNGLAFHCWEIIQSCISGYLIKQSYSKLKDRIQLFNNDNEFIIQNCNEIIDENDFIELRSLGSGAVSDVYLIYHIKKEELLAIKKRKYNDPESDKVGQREIANYSTINFPFVPKFIGKFENSSDIIIEYINGHSLYDIQDIHLNENEKFIIIMEMMMTIEFFHRNHFIYRDLKPTNVIIDENKTAVIIDLDRMIFFNDTLQNKNHTNIFSSAFAAPEVNDGNFSYKCDVFSLGQMIYFILNEKYPPENKNKKIFFHSKEISEIYKRCTFKNEKERPSIIELITLFYINFQSKFENLSFIKKYIQRILNEIRMKWNKKSDDINEHINFLEFFANINDVNSQFKLGLLFSENKEVAVDIKKAIHYYELASNQNHVESQFNLGVLYYKDQYISRDINKAIYYLTLAAKQDYPKALFNLGLIYFEGKYVPRDINKAIQLYSIAANKNFSLAQLNLGNIYYNGVYVQKDIEKAIHFYELAVNNNSSDAQFNLGNIYYDVKKDIKKAIYYYSLSANQNNSKAQLILGKIYYKGRFVSRDILKALPYLLNASKQNEYEAQYLLGVIYIKGLFIERDINKGIYYLTLSSNNNYSEAQYCLGVIYSNDKYGIKDINKAIHYYTLSADQNNSEAQIDLSALLYENKIDVIKAIHYLSMAADNNNNPYAQYNLGTIYTNKRDINKAIKYLTLAANQGYLKAQYSLGMIYYEGQFLPVDINKSIHYFKLASNKDDSPSQNCLGVIYYNGKYIARDINKSIYYFSISANKNFAVSQYNLGVIYYEGQYIQRNIKKAIHYFQLAADQKIPEAQLNLGLILLEGKYVKPDISKGIRYLMCAANSNNHQAQLNLGRFYYEGRYVEKNINKAIYYLTLSAEQNDFHAAFCLGYLYHIGKDAKCDIKKAIHYYKESSSFNNHYAKNNLGIIYKNGFGNDVEKNIGFSIEYFEESIRKSNDIFSMYNLSAIYLFNNLNQDKMFEMLIKLSKSGLMPAKKLLCLALIKKIGFDLNYDSIKSEINLYECEKNDLPRSLFNIIVKYGLRNPLIFNIQYEAFQKIDFIYDYSYNINLMHLMNQNNENIQKENPARMDITTDFYEGFEN